MQRPMRYHQSLHAAANPILGRVAATATATASATAFSSSSQPLIAWLKLLSNEYSVRVVFLKRVVP